jgi:hypothetical protein
VCLHVQGAAARAATQANAPGTARKAGPLPALAQTPPVASSPTASRAAATSQPVYTSKPCCADSVAIAAGTGTADNTAAQQKRQSASTSHPQAPAKVARTCDMPVSSTHSQQMSYPRRTSHTGVQGGDVRDNEVMNALRASFQQDPEGLVRLLLQSLDKQFPGAMREAVNGHNTVAAQLLRALQQSHQPDVAAARGAILQHLLQVNPGLVAQLGLAASAAVEGTAPSMVAAPAVPKPPEPVVKTEPVLQQQASKDFTAILMELQQCGASDQMIMHVLQALMQQHHAAPTPLPQQQPVAPRPAPQPTPAFSLGTAVDPKLLAASPNVLLTALCRQPVFGAAHPGAVPSCNAWQNDQRAAAVASHMHAHMHESQRQPQHRSVQQQLPAVSGLPGSHGTLSTLPLGEPLRRPNTAPVSVGAGNWTDTQLAQILSGLESASRVHAARSQQ